jgi:hypothetical protein
MGDVGGKGVWGVARGASAITITCIDSGPR